MKLIIWFGIYYKGSPESSSAEALYRGWVSNGIAIENCLEQIQNPVTF